MSDNPLLDQTGLPRFDTIEPHHVEPAVRALVSRMLADLDTLEQAPGDRWDTLIAPLTELTEPLERAWGVVGHLMSVKNSAELRAAHDAVQPDVVQASMRVEQSRSLYAAAVALREGPGWDELDEGQRRVVASAIRDAELAGVGLEDAARDRFKGIQLELADLSTKFMNHVLDATKAFSLELTDPAEVEGLPASALERAAQAAGAADPEAGPWKITLDAPSFIPFMEHSRRRDLRERMYRAYVTRAASGDRDNQPIIDRILRLRQEKAELLGYRNFVEVSLRAKMAPDVDAVDRLLGELRDAALPAARREHAELTNYARAESGERSLELALWDVPFWAERMREARYAYTDEELRPYFPLPRVLEGLFATATRLFGVTVRAADGETPVWDPDVRFFRVADESGADIAAFFLDPYSRPDNKRGGAWMNDALGRKRRADGSVQAPVAYLVCNSTPPVGETPALMTFKEVETLFHEFGHGLQHMLTRVDHPKAAGINNIEWDAVELPSQFMENWCYREETILTLARHHATGEPLPRDLFDKIVAARNYRAGSATVRQLYFASLDLALHREPPTDVLAVQRRIAAENTVLAPLPEDRFLCSFAHIFAGGYAAGYYSYKWAEVLSADAFSAFEEAGLDDAGAVAATGRRFRDTVLALGGSKPPMEVFVAFRGREPSTQALLEHTGLVNQELR
jgi:oligopeptidase A